ncbi:MAG: hypothetical protein ACREBC_18145, partial [Pyrinomonadaceae bacterium]
TARSTQSRRLTNSLLAQVASNAAVEFDCYLRGRQFGFDAVTQLASYLQSEIKEVNEPPTPSSLLNPSVAVVMSRAIRLSNWPTKEITTVADLVSKANEISKELQSSEDLLDETPTTETTVQKLRDFCVALSKAAAEQRHSIEDTIPDHPYRR